MTDVTIHGYRLTNVHDSAACKGRHCIVHNPKHTHMDDWPVHYRRDRNLFERVCKHNVGHPDRSQEDFWAETGREYDAIHGCCMDDWGLMCCDSSDEARKARRGNGVRRVG